VPNGCSQHHVAGIGFQGSIRKLGDKVAPQCFVIAGGGADGAGTTFGGLAAKVPPAASRTPSSGEMPGLPDAAPADFIEVTLVVPASGRS
jgi:sulfite reductase (NADPH) hemoprotein beta-component